MEVWTESHSSRNQAICDFPIIFDAQKGGTDIPSITEEQVRLVAESGVDAFIACPPGSGTKTLEAFVNKSFEFNVIPIVLVEMTHPMANVFLKENAGEQILLRSLELGVKYFVAPGNDPEKILKYKTLAKSKGKDIKIFSPGLGFQGGDPNKAGKAGTDFFIVGRSLYNSEDPRKEVLKTYMLIKA